MPPLPVSELRHDDVHVGFRRIADVFDDVDFFADEIAEAVVAVEIDLQPAVGARRLLAGTAADGKHTRKHATQRRTRNAIRDLLRVSVITGMRDEAAVKARPRNPSWQLHVLGLQFEINRMLLLVLSLFLQARRRGAERRRCARSKTTRSARRPPGFILAAGRDAAADRWTVQARRQRRASSCTKAILAADGFAVAVFSGAQYQDVEVSVRLKATGGGRTAGLVWKYQDPMNHYVGAAGSREAGAGDLPRRQRQPDPPRARRRSGARSRRVAFAEVLQEDGEIRVYLGGIRVFSERDRLPRGRAPASACGRRRHDGDVRRLPRRRRNRGHADRRAAIKKP